jgi:hypothetical protein
LHQYSFAKKLQSKDVIKEMLSKVLLKERGVQKLLMKFTLVVNSINILQAAFAPISIC